MENIAILYSGGDDISNENYAGSMVSSGKVVSIKTIVERGGK